MRKAGLLKRLGELLDGGGILVPESADDPSCTKQLDSLGISLDEFVEKVTRSGPGKAACPQVNRNHVEDRKSKMMRDGTFCRKSGYSSYLHRSVVTKWVRYARIKTERKRHHTDSENVSCEIFTHAATLHCHPT